jgi:Cd2+/Zn2+-exporting ATPase/Cu+-exporting ATPase
MTRQASEARGHAYEHGSVQVGDADQITRGTAGHDDAGAGDEHRAGDWVDLARVGLVALAAALVWIRLWEPFPRFSVIGVAALIVGAWPILHEPWRTSSSDA